MTYHFEKVVPFALARKILDGFIPLAKDREGTGNLIRKIWQGHMATPAAGELTRLYNEQAAPDDVISEPVNRIAASMVLNELIENIYGLRMTVLANDQVVDGAWWRCPPRRPASAVRSSAGEPEGSALRIAIQFPGGTGGAAGAPRRIPRSRAR